MSLFGGTASQARRNLVEFKAGKMNLRSNMVSSINLAICSFSIFNYRFIQINEKVWFIYIKATICWCISVGKIDQIIQLKMILLYFQKKLNLKKLHKIQQVKFLWNYTIEDRSVYLVGRVYILKWRSNARKLFFWMQEPEEDTDEEFCEKINDLVSLMSEI